VCANGQCGTGCAAGMTNCNGYCTDLSLDYANCGACGQNCFGDGGVQYCVNGQCSRCPADALDCGGTCADPHTDRDHCGDCATRCAAGEVCVAGHCSATCPMGLSNCSGSC